MGGRPELARGGRLGALGTGGGAGGCADHDCGGCVTCTGCVTGTWRGCGTDDGTT